MKTNPILTIAIPTYNRLDLLKNCLNSVLTQMNQTETDVEVLCIDNNSPDDTAKYLNDVTHPSFRYFSNQTNIGVERNILRVTSEARGDYIFWLSDDDLLLPGSIDYLKLLLGRMPANVGWIFSPLPTYDDTTGLSICNIRPSCDRYTEIKPSFIAVLQYAHFGWAFSRQIFSRHLLSESSLKVSTGNMYFLLNLSSQMLLQYKSIYLPKPLIYHRYGNKEYWEEFGADKIKQKAKAALDYASIVPTSLRKYTKATFINNIYIIVASLLWIMSASLRWVRNNLDKHFLKKVFFIYQEAKTSSRTLLFIVYLSAILALTPFEALRLGIKKLFISSQK